MLWLRGKGTREFTNIGGVSAPKPSCELAAVQKPRTTLKKKKKELQNGGTRLIKLHVTFNCAPKVILNLTKHMGGGVCPYLILLPVFIRIH